MSNIKGAFKFGIDDHVIKITENTIIEKHGLGWELQKLVIFGNSWSAKNNDPNASEICMKEHMKYR